MPKNFQGIFRSLMDVGSRFSFTRELVTDLAQKQFANKLHNQSKFDAVVLQSDLVNEDGRPTAADASAGTAIRSPSIWRVYVRPLDIHDLLVPEPCKFKDQATRDYCISLHPVALSEQMMEDGSGNHTISPGDIVSCYYLKGPDNRQGMKSLRFNPNRVGIAADQQGKTFNCGGKIVDLVNFSANGSQRYPKRTPSANRNQSPSRQTTQNDSNDSAITGDMPYGLKPRKGWYTGIATNGVKTRIYNGYPKTTGTITKVPDQTYANTKVRGSGHMVVDAIPSFEKMAKAFYEHFGKKLRCSANRSFKGQLAVRKRAVDATKAGKRPNSPCKTMTEKYKKGGCGSAVPGASGHGWGIAIDIYRFDGGSLIRKRSRKKPQDKNSRYKKHRKSQGYEIYDWMHENAHKYGWHHPQWAHTDMHVEDHHWIPMDLSFIEYPGKAGNTAVAKDGTSGRGGPFTANKPYPKPPSGSYGTALAAGTANAWEKQYG